MRSLMRLPPKDELKWWMAAIVVAIVLIGVFVGQALQGNGS